MVGKLKLDSGKVRSFRTINNTIPRTFFFWQIPDRTIKAEKGKKLHIVDFEDNKNKVAYSLKCLINN
jgi:hypothetical protein